MIGGVHIGSEGWKTVQDETIDAMKHEWHGGFERNLNCFVECIGCDELEQEMPSADGTAESEAEREIETGCYETAKEQRLMPESQQLP